MFSVPSYPGENRGKRLEHIGENTSRSRDFYPFKKYHKLCRGFYQTMMARRTCFISFIDIYIFNMNIIHYTDNELVIKVVSSCTG